jgi:3-oxoadipate enol-lactonase
MMLRVLGPKRFAGVLAPKLFPRPEQAALRQKMQERIAANDPSAYLRATRGIMGWSVLHRLKDVTCPVLVLASDRDYTPLSEKRAYVDRLADARLKEVKDSGHAAPLDQPLQIVEAATDFFSEVESAGGSRPQG